MLNTRLSDLLKASMESLDELPEGGVVEVNDPQSVDAALLEASEAEQSMEMHASNVERLTDIATGMEAVCAELEASLETGGLSPQAASLLNVAVEAYTRPLGLEEALVPSTEAFGGEQSREAATRVSLEAVNVTLKKVWDAIKAAARKVWDAIVSFVKKLFDAAERLEQSAKAVGERADKVGSGKAKSDNIKLGGLAKKIAVGSNASSVMANLATLEKFADGCIEVDEKLAAAIGNWLEAVSRLVTSTNDDVDANLERVKELKSPVVGKGFFKDPKNDDMFRSIDLPGNTYFVVGMKDGVVTSNVGQSEANVPDDVEASTLTAEQIKQVAKAAIKVAALTKAFKSAKANQDNIQKVLNSQISADLSDENAAKVKAQLQRMVSNANKANQFNVRLGAYLVRTASAFLKVAKLSLAQYGGAKEEKSSNESLTVSEEGVRGLAGAVLGAVVGAPLGFIPMAAGAIAGATTGGVMDERAKVKKAKPGSRVRRGYEYGTIKSIKSEDFEMDGVHYTATLKKPMIVVNFDDKDKPVAVSYKELHMV